MIKFERRGKVVQVVVTLYVPTMGERVWTFNLWEDNHEWVASFWVHAARDALFQKLRAIREDAYNRGWKDAKSKTRAKETYFRGTLD